MERLFREIVKYGFNDEWTGALIKMSLEYMETGEAEVRDKSITRFFYCNIAQKIDKLKRDRKRKAEKRYEEKERFDN